MSQTYRDFNKRKDSIKIELENGHQYRIGGGGGGGGGGLFCFL